MKASEILDHYEHDFHSLMDRDDKILWSGQPEALSELFSLGDVKNGRTRFNFNLQHLFFHLFRSTSVVSLFLLSGLLIIYGDFIFMWYTILYAMFFEIFPTVIDELKQRGTAYAVSKKGVLFKLWKYGKVKYEFVFWKDVIKINVTHESDNYGVIHFMCSENVQFFTYAFGQNKKRFNPTFENITDVEYWADEFRKIKKDAKQYKYTN